MLTLLNKHVLNELTKLKGQSFDVKEFSEQIGITDRTYYNQVKKLEQLELVKRDSVRSKESRVIILKEV